MCGRSVARSSVDFPGCPLDHDQLPGASERAHHGGLCYRDPAEPVTVEPVQAAWINREIWDRRAWADALGPPRRGGPSTNSRSMHAPTL